MGRVFCNRSNFDARRFKKINLWKTFSTVLKMHVDHDMTIGKWPSLGVASGQALHLRELWDSFMGERHKATRGGGKESLQWSLQNFHFCFAQMKQNTIAWKMMHHQLILIDDIPGWPAINTCYFWGLHGCIFTVRSQPRRIYKPANHKAEKGLPGKHGYYTSPYLLCLKVSPQWNHLISYLSRCLEDWSPPKKKAIAD